VLTAPSAGDLLHALLQIPSVSGDEDRLAEWLVGRLGELGFLAERDQAGNVVAGWGSGPREVVLLGHIDTVPGLSVATAAASAGGARSTPRARSPRRSPRSPGSRGMAGCDTR